MLEFIQHRLAQLEALKNELLSLINQQTSSTNQLAVQAHQTNGAILELQNLAGKVSAGVDLASNIAQVAGGNVGAIIGAVEDVTTLLEPATSASDTQPSENKSS
jgi:methyl-accepting chemotaxis protein